MRCTVLSRRLASFVLGCSVAGLLLLACTNGDEATPDQPTTATTGATPSTAPEAATQFALHRYEEHMPDAWHAPISIPFGDDPAQLGTSLGGDGEGIQWGPRYGAVAPDGTWWILDGAKFRFAHYDASGAFLDAVPIPSEHLVQGRYMQWQYPMALADGAIVTFRLSGPDRTVLLLLRDGRFDEVALDRQVVVKGDDGVLLYGLGGQGEMLAVDVATGTVTDVEAFRSRTGVPYRLARDGPSLRFELPDQGIEQHWPLVAAETGGPAAGAISLASTADGRWHLFVDGAAEDDPTTGRSGYGLVDESGALRPTEPTRDPWSTSDDGSGSRLIARPGGNEVWLITIDTDAVRLYQRAP